jgi:flavin reductase (DIM6/NTAB) family NADH-FMN oxidoreductase RutF
MEKPNIITVAWICMFNDKPPTIGCTLKKSRYSLALILAEKCFGVNIPSAQQFVETDFCGIVSGRDIDKFKATGFTAVKGKHIDAPLIEECPFNMECTLVKTIEINEERLFILGEILETHVDDDKVIDAKRCKLDISRIDPLVYCARVREYWSVGEKLGDGYSAGKALLSR